MTTRALLQRRERLLGQRMPLFYSEPVHIVRGEGIWLYDASGKQYMDLYNHGNSTEVRRMSDARRDREGNPEIRAIPYPQLYRPLDPSVSEAELTELYLGRVREAIADFRRHDMPFAGMFVCSLLVNEGLPDIPGGFMPRAAEIVREAGGVFIADEVQAGFCRSGRWWGYQTSGFVPDIVTMGKPMGAGLPLAGVVARPELVDAFREKTGYFNTFASSPLQATVGMAVLDELEERELLDMAEVSPELHALALKALTAWELKDPRVRPIGVSENASFRVDTPERRYVLRIHRPGYHTLAELESEHVWTDALLKAGVDVPVTKRPARATNTSRFRSRKASGTSACWSGWTANSCTTSFAGIRAISLDISAPLAVSRQSFTTRPPNGPCPTGSAGIGSTSRVCWKTTRSGVASAISRRWTRHNGR